MPVTTGIVSGEVAEVKEPAIAGVVVTLGNHLLEDGAKVILPQSGGRRADARRAPAPRQGGGQ